MANTASSLLHETVRAIVTYAHRATRLPIDLVCIWPATDSLPGEDAVRAMLDAEDPAACLAAAKAINTLSEPLRR